LFEEEPAAEADDEKRDDEDEQNAEQRLPNAKGCGEQGEERGSRAAARIMFLNAAHANLA